MIETSTCPSCGGGIEKGDRFCQECGRALSTIATASTKSLVEKLHSFRAELILLGAVLIYAVSVVCWTDRASLMNLANMPGSWFAKSAPHESNVESKSTPTSSTARGASVEPSKNAHRAGNEGNSELQSLFSKSQTFPSVNVGTARRLTAKSSAAVPATPVPTPAAPAKKLIAQRKVTTSISSDSSNETAEQTTSEIASDSAAEATDNTKASKAKKSIKTDTKAIADVAEYNRLLADYFARKKSDSDSPDSASEPPSYQEWIAGRKPYF